MTAVPVYSSTAFAQGAFGTAFPGSNTVNAVVIYPADSIPYIDVRLATVTNGKLNVDLGTTSLELGATKQTALVLVDATGGNKADAVWKSSQVLNFGSSAYTTATPGQTAGYDRTRDAAKYNGTFSITDVKGNATNHTVTDLASLNQYNDWLIDEMKAGRLDYSTYEANVKRAYTLTPVTVRISPMGVGNTFPADHPLYQPVGDRALMQAKGAQATATIDSGANITLKQGTALLATDGGAVVNNGRVAQTLDESVAFDIRSGSNGVNNGVMTVGYGSTDPDAKVGTGTVYFNASNKVTDAGSVLTNKGIINVGATNRDARNLGSIFVTIEASENGEFVNEGAMNLGVNDSPLFNPVQGVRVSTGAKATNAATGVIYLGRGSSTDMSGGSMAAGGADTTINAGGNAMIVRGGGTGINDGRIVIGKGMQDSTAMRVDFESGASKVPAVAINNGTIDVNGALSGSPLQNRGMWANASGASVVENVGVINLNGVNGVGMKANAGGTATNTGTINLGTSTNAKLPNYGLWAEGANSAVTLTGSVNMNGDNAIGVHARDSGTITVAGGDVNFNNGSRQVGFFAHGAGSVVDVTSAPVSGALDVSTKDSTLIRVEDGGKVNVKAATPLVASGAGSTAIQATGVGSTANLDGTNITVSGNGATALKVEGGATGSMSGAALLTLKDGSIAVAVDDNKYDLAGNKVATGQSTFTNTANVMVANARDVTVFQVKNGAELVNAGNIDVAHGTAIEITGAGSVVSPDASGKRGTITMHDGKAGIWVHDGATLTTSDTITVDNAASGVLVGTDAGKVVLTKDAQIIGTGTGFGNLVTNQGAAGNTLLDGTFLEMQGSGAALLTENNLDAASHGTILVSSATGGKGLALTNADGSATSGNLVVGNAFDISVTGNGSGVYANTTGDLTVTSKSVNVSGAGQAVLVKSAGTVTIDQAATLTATNPGAVLVAGAPRTLINHGTLQGVAGSDAVRLDDSGHAFENSNGGNITGNVVMGNGTNMALLADSTITGNFVGGTGQDTVTVRGNAATVTGALDGGKGNAIDTLVFEGSQRTIDASNNIANFENVNLTNGSVLTLKTAIKLDDNQADTGVVTIDPTSTLAVAMNSAFALNNKLAGTGTVTTDTAGQAFDFTSNVGNAFAGTVKLGDSSLALGGANTTALQNATLELGDKSITAVADGDQAIGGLTFNGGTAKFNATAPDYRVAASTITTRTLDASGAGNVQINVPAPYVASTPTVDTRASLLEQDDANIGIKLINASTTGGSGGALVLQDQDGQPISVKRSVDIAQGGQVVAKGDYDYRLTTLKDDGLYVNYGLTQLDLQAGQLLSLQQRAGAVDNAADMSARITGAGNLGIDAGTGTVSLSNTTNDYTGVTMVSTGTLKAAANNAFGKTSALYLTTGTAAELDRYEQTIGTFAGEYGSTLDLQTGTLNIIDGGDADGILKGSGRFNVNGGTLAVSGSNAELAGATSIASGAAVKLKQADGLGSSTIANAGTLTLDGAQGTLANTISGTGQVGLVNAAAVNVAGDNSAFSGQFSTAAGTRLTVSEGANLGTAKVANAGTLVLDTANDWALANAVAGSGNVVKNGAGTLTVGDNVQHTGGTNINAGALIVGGTLGAVGAGAVNVAQAAVLSGTGTVNGHVMNSGTVAAFNALPASAGAPNSTLTLASGLTSNGIVNLAGPASTTPGNVLLVKGDYVGNNGRLVIRTVMGDDASATDKLVIDGGNASGSTGVVVKSAGGIGAQTLQGIRVVETRNGATTQANAFWLDASSSGYRQGVGTLAVGAFDYGLVRGGNGGKAQDWYLSSAKPPAPVIEGPGFEPPVDPVGPGVPVEPRNPREPVAGGPIPEPVAAQVAAPAMPVYRPEVGAYLANRQAAMQMSVHTLHERQGQAPGMEGKDLKQSSDSNGWLRVVDTYSSRDGLNPSSTLADRTYLLHGGADVARFSDGGEGSFRVGAMGMYGRTDNTSTNANLMSATGSVNGGSLGVYGTWYGKQDILSGPYVDAWILGGHYKNKVRGLGLAQESYSANSISASLEAGYSFKIFDDGKSQMYVEPQAQVIVQNYRASNHTEATGTIVSGMKDTSVTTRLGVRVHGHTENDNGNKMMRPFAEINWWHGNGSDASMMFNADRVVDGMPSNRFEAKVGLQGNLTKNISAWGSIGGEVGAKNYQAAKAQVGVKYSW
ncbi:autotransporter outer membrane beta-barrel domain-containing protein [Variovorax rhizosphaerae]|uniref:Autotransporter outer membrane beta-barrel domain-containing protein n=1 Tax=Variovorax rhizosphaerae TaxID=1836200 RepID=A0ABU8WK46_9BURK